MVERLGLNWMVVPFLSCSVGSLPSVAAFRSELEVQAWAEEPSRLVAFVPAPSLAQGQKLSSSLSFFSSSSVSLSSSRLSLLYV